MATLKQKEYYGGRIKGLVEGVAAMVAKDPSLATDLGRLHASLAASLEAYGKRDTCFNCRRSMKISVYTADLHDALLILAIGNAVRGNMERGANFTEANKVHLPTLQGITNATLKRQTKCDYLGFIKQPKEWRGSGYWLLTSWGWKALAGKTVPRSVKYWEGNLIGRSEELTTLAEMFRTHTELVAAALAKRAAVKADYRANFKDYNPSDWSQFSGFIQDEK